jgi:hypothetical protein
MPIDLAQYEHLIVHSDYARAHGPDLADPYEIEEIRIRNTRGATLDPSAPDTMDMREQWRSLRKMYLCLLKEVGRVCDSVHVGRGLYRDVPWSRERKDRARQQYRTMITVIDSKLEDLDGDKKSSA